jgi:hypothetical protein
MRLLLEIDFLISDYRNVRIDVSQLVDLPKIGAGMANARSSLTQFRIDRVDREFRTQAGVPADVEL